MNCPYKPETMLFRLMNEDWSGKTIEEIAIELNSMSGSVRSSIHRIKDETGYVVKHVRAPPIPYKFRDNAKNEIDFYYKLRKIKEKEKIQKTCGTCWNSDCVFLTRRKAVCWLHCSGWKDE